MRRVTISEIDEMRSRGFDPSTIQEARAAYERGLMGDQLIVRIEAAFHGVVLGDGIGLWEGQGLDDYADAAARAALREDDEKDDWRNIPPDVLTPCGSSLSFFGAKGMRFHLPAFKTADLRDQYDGFLIPTLTLRVGSGRDCFAALNRDQRRAVREFLLFLKDDPDYRFSKHQIERSLTEFWSEQE